MPAILLTTVVAAGLASADPPRPDAWRTPIGECAPFLYDGWEPIGPGEAGGLQSVRPHPTVPNVIIAGSDSLGIQLSRDGGKTWRHVFRQPTAADLVMRPDAPEVLYAAILERATDKHGRGGVADPARFAPGLYRTRDGGATWENVTGGLKDLMTNYRCLAVNPADPDVLYVGCTGGFWRKRMD